VGPETPDEELPPPPAGGVPPRLPADAPVLLLTHKPLFRPNDLDCGPERAAEGGHVTYEAPEAGLRPGPDGMVLARDASASLLRRLRPAAVFSGHTHARCRRRHGDGPAEHTLPAFGWRMRPDPSFAVVDLSNVDVSAVDVSAVDVSAAGEDAAGGDGAGKGGREGRRGGRARGGLDVDVWLCALPDERTVFAVLIAHLVAAVAAAAVALRSSDRCRQTSPWENGPACGAPASAGALAGCLPLHGRGARAHRD
jgi:hypothetical protein